MDTRPINVLSICSGYGGIELGLRSVIPARTVCYVENEIGVASILAARMEDGALDPAPIWSDLTTFDPEPWRGRVDILAGGFPCQPHSVAGSQLGEDDPRELSGEVLRIAAGLGYPTLFLENVPGILRFYWDSIRPELRKMGYEVAEGLFTASETGAPHKRERLFILAHRDGRGRWENGFARGMGEMDEREANLSISTTERHSRKGVADADARRQGEPRVQGEARERRRRLGLNGNKLADAGSERGQGRELYARDESEASGRGQTGASRSSGEAHVADAEGSGGSHGIAKTERQGRSPSSGTGGDNQLAHADGPRPTSITRDDGEERSVQEAECQPEHGAIISGGSSSELADAGCRELPKVLRIADGQSTKPDGEELADATEQGLQEGEPSSLGGSPTAQDRRGNQSTTKPMHSYPQELADADHEGSQGWDKRRDSARECTAWKGGPELGELPLYPPGPGDHEGWAYMLSIMPAAQPTFCRDDNGTMSGVDRRLRAAGNGVIPAVAALAFAELGRAIERGGGKETRDDAIA